MVERRFILAILTTTMLACGSATESELFGTPPVGADAGVDAAKDAGGDARDAAQDTGPTLTPIIACGPPLANPQAKCDASKQELCCRRGDTEPFKYSCETQEQNCADPTDVPIHCSSTATCAGLGLVGSVCCGTLVSTGGSGTAITGTTCVAPSNCVSGGSVGRAILCDPGSPNACPNGGTCKLSAQTMPGYYLCI